MIAIDPSFNLAYMLCSKNRKNYMKLLGVHVTKV